MDVGAHTYLVDVQPLRTSTSIVISSFGYSVKRSMRRDYKFSSPSSLFVILYSTRRDRDFDNIAGQLAYHYTYQGMLP